MDWHDSCIMSIYKWKGDKDRCRNLRSISLLNRLAGCIVDC